MAGGGFGEVGVGRLQEGAYACRMQMWRPYMQPDEQKKEEGTDFSQFAMNPVVIAQKADKIPALRQSVKVFGIVIGIVVIAVAVRYWARLGHEISLHGALLDQAKDSSIRMRAEVFKQDLVGDVPGLAGRLDGVRFEESQEEGTFVIGVDIRPAITDESGVTRPVGKDDVTAIVRAAAKELASFVTALEVVQFKEAIARGYLRGTLAGTASYKGRTRESRGEMGPAPGPR
jgi:hypothetical protein